jgi:hypothetical protein
VRRLQLQPSGQKRPTILTSLSFVAKLACNEVRTQGTLFSDVKSSIEAFLQRSAAGIAC